MLEIVEKQKNKKTKKQKNKDATTKKIVAEKTNNK